MNLPKTAEPSIRPSIVAEFIIFQCCNIPMLLHSPQKIKMTILYTLIIIIHQGLFELHNVLFYSEIEKQCTSKLKSSILFSFVKLPHELSTHPNQTFQTQIYTWNVMQIRPIGLYACGTILENTVNVARESM